MKNFVIMLLLICTFSAYGQDFYDKIVYSSVNNDTIFFKVEVSLIENEINLKINLVNYSNQVIYIDTSFITPFAIKLNKKYPYSAEGIGITHLTKNEIDENNIYALSLKPTCDLNLNYVLAANQYKYNLNNVKFYFFCIKYIMSSEIDDKYIIKDLLEIPMITYYFKSHRLIIGNGDYQMMTTE